ncbi:energy-coupling factor ABC transporter permease [Lutibacter sp. HS1-25]|uniref:energy-coupling factor ABC transporter permease n=1 Tax=Lutibacter sp. HS1-25 TaxID=2485000 RepID=UPI001010DB2F|nr:energy-coupling factor ABC transporter permease [Lutibacter sp. HS1-25]RXP61354.1 energy-coupling factor ABC transporter permease [Lutibacter sp. HS1-25]
MKKYLSVLYLFLLPLKGFSMHIAEGFLPKEWALLWVLVFVPFLIVGFRKLKKQLAETPKAKMLFAVVAAFVFVLSSFKIPSVAGSSSHLTGIALGAILFGASTMSVAGLIVLLFQALLLAHGGITTLGANAFSMTVVGAFSAVWVYKLASKLRLSQWLSVFLAAFVSDILIYIATSLQLALAFQSETNSLLENTTKFMSVFAITQVPLAIIEGVFTAFVFKLILNYSKTELGTINPSIL